MASTRAPFVALRTDIRKEERVRFTAEFAGYNEYEAIGRYASLWCWCTDRGLEDAPEDCEGYAVPDAVVRRFLGARGVEAILGDGCDELAMGERRPDDLIYLRGTSDTVDRLRSLRATARSGGRSQAATGQRDQAGRFVSTTTLVQLTDQPESSRAPAALQPQPARSQIPDPRSLPEDQNSLAACAIPAAAADTVQVQAVQEQQRSAGGAGATPAPALPQPAPAREDIARTQPAAKPATAAPAYDPGNPFAIGRLAETTYRRVSDALLKIAAELKLPEPLPFPAITPASSGRTRDLRDRVREEGADAPTVCDRIVANLIAQAREERSIEWLAEKAFTEGGWRTARAWMPGAAARRRGPARGDPLPPAPAPPRPDRPPPDPVLSAEDRAELSALAARVGANPEAAAAELAGRPSSLPTAELVKRFGDGPRAPPGPDPITDEPRKQPKSRKAAT